MPDKEMLAANPSRAEMAIGCFNPAIEHVRNVICNTMLRTTNSLAPTLCAAAFLFEAEELEQ